MFCLVKKVSAENGPLIKILSFLKNLIAGLIILSSSPTFSIDSQCGFKPKIANLGFIL